MPFWRIIATTIRDQEAELAPCSFRKDFYYRLNIMLGPVSTNEIATAGGSDNNKLQREKAHNEYAPLVFSLIVKKRPY
jgi:hypothetical protein